ncbi:MAG: glycosyltransferase family 2 protein [Phycisphaerae bacterium]|jgi:chlorobactene glucosyltransferase
MTGSFWFTWWFVLAGFVGAIWVVRVVNMRRILRRREVLGSFSPDSLPEAAPKVSVVVAAKDEEADIEACVTSLLDQDYPEFEVIVVDDRSTDRTPAILAGLRASHGDRLRVIEVDRVREGWCGKNNAMREGVSVSSGDWLLFTDADCRQTSRRAIRVAMCEALRREADFLSITPVLETHASWERMIQPVCTLVLMTWFLPHHVNKPHRKTAYANGAFMLMRRTCYDAIGGHERVRTEVNEDIQMARIAKRAGLRLRVVENDDLYRTRMYDSLGAGWRGWSRIYYGSFASLGSLILAATVLTVASLVPWVCLMVSIIAVAGSEGTGEPLAWTAAGVWFVLVTMEQIVAWRLYAVLRVPRVWSLGYPIGVVFTLGMFGNAMFKKLGVTSTTWRGTRYRGGLPVRRTQSAVPQAGTETDHGTGGGERPAYGARSADGSATYPGAPG